MTQLQFSRKVLMRTFHLKKKKRIGVYLPIDQFGESPSHGPKMGGVNFSLKGEVFSAAAKLKRAISRSEEPTGRLRGRIRRRTYF